MEKFTLSVFLNFFGAKDSFFGKVAEKSCEQDFLKDDLKEQVCSNQSMSGRGVFSLILLFAFFLFSNFLTAQVITVDGLTSDWSGNPSVKHVQDAFGNGVVDNQFTEGSKDFLLASDLAWVIGQTKAKNDIANGGFGLANQVKYVDSNNTMQTLNGSFLVFAGDRTSNNGDAQIGFWFYLNATAPVDVNGSRYFAPPHVRGDLLVLADFTGGGRLGTVKVYRWIGGGVVTPGSTVVPNTNGNLETTDIASVVAENNSGTPNVPTGWNFSSGQYQTNEFYEGFVDLGAIGGNTNFTCSATVLLETRSSQSVTASLDDFIGGTLGDVPTVTVNSLAVCDGQSATITATPGSSGTYIYAWTVPQGAVNPGNVASFTASIGGTYSVIITTLAGCPSSPGSGTLTVKPVPTVSVNSPSVCNGLSATLTATPSLPGGTYLWNTGETTASITVSPSSTTSYSVVYTLDGCPSPSSSGTVTVKPVPTVSVNSPSVCNGTSTTLTATPSLPGGTYLWNTGATTASITVSPSSTTSYSVVYTLDGCPSPSSSGTVTVKPVPTVSVNSPSVCNGSSATLTATPSLPGGTYLWNTGATTASITVSPSSTTTYSVVYTLNGCSSPSASGTVTVIEIPTVTADPKNVCIGSTVGLTGSPAGGTWSGENVSGNMFNAAGLTDGDYTVTYTFVNSLTGCEKSVNATITVSNCSTPLCTYTQGYYGNPGGTSCANGVSCSTKGLIAKALSSYPDHKMVIGKAGNSFWMTDSAADIDKIIEILPGGGNSYALSLGGDKEITTISGNYLKKGNINNTLLAQTITLGLNLGIDSHLGSLDLHSGKLAVASPQGGCGSNVPMPRTCSYDVYTPTINEYKYYDIPAIVDLLPNKTVQGLFEMANKALAGDPLPAGVTLSGLASAVDLINNAFDGCKISMGYGQTPLTCIEDRASFVFYPVPVVDFATIHYNFNYTTTVKIEVRSLNSNGAVVYTQSDVFDGTDADRDVIVNYNFSTAIPQVYFIRVITNIGYSSKQVISN